MINVLPQPEPANFNDRVRKPGNKFLNKRLNPTVAPTNKEYKSRSYWTRALPDLHEAYNHICAYSCEKIPLIVGNKQVDHYIPKSQSPYQLAYEWSNYRLAAGQLNTWKSTDSVLDPFIVQDGWFIMQFPSLQVIPASAKDLPNNVTQKQIQDTIDVLHLNDPMFERVRKGHLDLYCTNNDFSYLLSTSPFIAKELARQGLTQSIKSIWII